MPRNWTEPEIEKAIELYAVTPFGRMHSRNPSIIKLAEELDRTSGSVALKLTNLASIDETLDRKGMSNASNLDRVVWKRFFDGLLALGRDTEIPLTTDTTDAFSEAEQSEYLPAATGPTSSLRMINARNKQNFFRRMIISNYDQKCAVTGISQPELLVAGHIRPWSTDPENRLNPRNGICLNRVHDRAFEEKLIAINADGTIEYSRRLEPTAKQKLMELSDTGRFSFPTKFKPDPAFLAEHYEAFNARELAS